MREIELIYIINIIFVVAVVLATVLASLFVLVAIIVFFPFDFGDFFDNNLQLVMNGCTYGVVYTLEYHYLSTIQAIFELRVSSLLAR